MEHRLSKLHRYARPEARIAQLHKHHIGACVTLLGSVTDPRSKERKATASSPQFEVTRTLPSEGRGLQYRIKNVTTGLEFIVVEEQIAPGH